MKQTHQSETSKHRARLAPFCEGYGLDIGFGGDPIIPTAIRMDLENPYGYTGDQGVQLGGDCRNLIWLRDEVLDYAYSSHVLEDFDITQTEHILREWTRILKVGGRLILLQPDQPRYLAYCRQHNQPPNAHHSIEHFSLKYVTETATRLGNLEVIASEDHLDEYSFFVVFKKIRPQANSTSGSEVEFLRRELARVNSLLETSEARLERYRRNPLVRLMRTIKNIGR
jgi:predicted SAM-dependent methyltransferase